MKPAEGIPRMSDTNGRQRSLEGRSYISRAVPREPPERELERLSARIAELEREREEIEGFVALAAHELVEPLVMTEAYAAIVAARLDGGAQSDSIGDLETLGRGAARARLLVETLLQDARSTGGVLQPEPVDLNVVVRDSLSLLRPHIEARQADVRVGTLPAVTGEEALLSGVFTNLVTNALKFNPRRGGAIEIGADEEPSLWRIFVRSDGPTIPPEDRERIFEPFNRGRGERRVRGAGLGLTICRRIVERHGGRIGVRPAGTNGTGNIFYFTLPAGG
jgi:signal transduction histidine kinase